VPKHFHEIRDPIHVFVRLDTHEREILDSSPFQRLRHIHQLALTYLVYPGASHKRFEHSLGVMELAGRVFDVVTNEQNITDEMRDSLPQLKSKDDLSYWRRVIRAAALCHDIGHLPFSHAAEKELLPDGWDHERLTRKIIDSDHMRPIWDRITPPIRSQDIIKLALGPKKANDLSFADWETILSEIIIGDAFGVDRMDYLLRDSHHVGVAYGHFDHYRLIDTLRLLPAPGDKKGGSHEPALGVEEGGLHSAEALMLARYFMYSQVYFHPVRRIYDIHLKDFLKKWLPSGVFSVEPDEHMKLTDNEVIAGLRESALDGHKEGHIDACVIAKREHFKVLYERNPNDVEINPEAGQSIFGALSAQFGTQYFRRDRYNQRSGAPDFPVRMRNGDAVSSLAVSETLNRVPIVSVDYVFADRSIFSEAEKWLKSNRNEIIQPKLEDENDGST